MASAPSPSLRNLFSELEQLLQTETEARVSLSVRAAERAQAEHLNQAVRRLRQAAGFAGIAAILCDASAPFCDACAVFSVNEEGVAGERWRGADDKLAARFRETRFTLSEAAAFAGVIQTREPVTAICSAAEIPPALIELFGHAPEEKAHLFPIAVEQSVAGLIYAAGAVESPALELLAQCAAASLAVQRWARAAPPDVLEIAPAPAAARPSAPDWGALSPADRSLHRRAQRFARVQVAEMRLYRADAVKAGRARGDLYAVLQEAIDSARAIYRETFVSATPTMTDYLHQELLRTLANENAAWLGEKYPGPLA